jgi:multidrug transporter EmrE-like cation transporter
MHLLYVILALIGVALLVIGGVMVLGHAPRSRANTGLALAIFGLAALGLIELVQLLKAG